MIKRASGSSPCSIRWRQRVRSSRSGFLRFRTLFITVLGLRGEGKLSRSQRRLTVVLKLSTCPCSSMVRPSYHIHVDQFNQVGHGAQPSHLATFWQPHQPFKRVSHGIFCLFLCDFHFYFTVYIYLIILSQKVCCHPTLPSSIYSVDRNMMHHAPTLGGSKG